MKLETKRELKQTVGDLLITALLVAIFVPLNKRCTHDKSAADSKQKIEKVESQQTKHNIWYRAPEKTR